jgi:hypothetical protein
MVVELNVIGNVYDNSKKDKPILVKRNLIYKKIFDTSKITVEEYTDNKANIVKSYSMITYDEQAYKVKHSYDYIKRLISPIQIIGLAYHSKKINKK